MTRAMTWLLTLACFGASLDAQTPAPQAAGAVTAIRAGRLLDPGRGRRPAESDHPH